jgi:hypothetical protein
VTDNNEHLKPLANAMSSYDKAVADLIRAELEELRPGLEIDLDIAVERLRTAYAALQLPAEQVAKVSEEIRLVEQELASYRADLESESVPVRISARVPAAEWAAELAALQAKKAQYEDALQVFTDEHKAAKDAKTLAEIAIEALDINKLTPFLGRGRFTQAYKAFRVGSYPAWLVLLAGDDSHPEYDVFLDSLDDVAASTGYRTDELAERLRQKAMQQSRDIFRRSPEPAPSGGEVVSEMMTGMERMAEAKAAEQTVSRIDDFRNAPTPRNDLVRDYMQVPGRKT